MRIEYDVNEMRELLSEAFWRNSAVFMNWLAMRLNFDRTGFERVTIQKDRGKLQEWEEQERLKNRTGQMVLL